MSGLQAAVAAAGCCCRPSPDSDGGGGSPAPCNYEEDAAIPSVTLNFSLTYTSSILNEKACRQTELDNAACGQIASEDYVETLTMTANRITLSAPSFQGIGVANVELTPNPPLHATVPRFCGTYCPGCPPPWNPCPTNVVPCCPGGQFQAHRLFADHEKIINMAQAQQTYQVVDAPSCCDPTGGCPEIHAGPPLGIEAWVGARLIPGCTAYNHPGTEGLCRCSPEDPRYHFDGYSIVVGVFARFTGPVFMPNKFAPLFPNLSIPPESYPSSVATYSKPCCTLSDNMRGTYYLNARPVSSGIISQPCNQGTWSVFRSATCTVS